VRCLLAQSYILRLEVFSTQTLLRIAGLRLLPHLDVSRLVGLLQTTLDPSPSNLARLSTLVSSLSSVPHKH
jgi:hypothetical protein